jgi:glucose/arabinose dehydrogenase
VLYAICRAARRVVRRSVAVALAIALVLVAGCGSSRHSSTVKGGPGALVPIGAGLDGPAGMTAAIYAHGPPTLAAFTFDAQGRLWLTAAGLTTHTEDGVYEIARPGARAVKVISGLSDPLGLLWYRGRLYVASIGRVDAFGEFRDGRFKAHTRILDGPVAGGENNLLALTPGGRLIMGVTASCDHCAPKSPFSGSIVTFRPDGGSLQIYAKRVRAAFGLAYFPGTNDLLVSMNQRDDLGARTPGDWLAVVREGQDWGFPGCYGQGGAACAGVPTPTAVLDKHAAAGGVSIVTGQLGATVGTAALVAEWQSAKVQRVALRRTGTTLTGSVTPFLTGVKNPLALTLAPEDSLLVGDWATGMIYRIRPSTGP